MTINALSRNTPVPARPRTAVAPATGTAARPRVQAQAAARPEKFSDVEAYKAHVLASEATRLPAARARVGEAERVLAEARRALTEKQGQLGHNALKAALDEAEKALVDTTYPLRGKAAEKRAEAERVSGEVAAVRGQIARLQDQIAQARGRQAARNRDFWFGSDDSGGDDVLGAIADGLGAIADGSTVSSGRRSIQNLIDQQVKLELKVATLTAEAERLHHQVGDAGRIAAATAKRDAARQAFDAALAAQAPEVRAVDAAAKDAAAAIAERDRLEGVKRNLQNYSAQFGFFTRVRLKLSNWSWRKELDAFWRAKGL